MNRLMKIPSQAVLVFIFLFVNDFFLLKYIPGKYLTWIAMLAYPICILSLLYAVRKSDFFKKVASIPGLLFATLPFIVFLYVKVSPFSVTPDRWSALYYWSDNLLHGVYPYASRTHMGGYGSPFPIWQLLHLPFYLMGDEIFAHVVMLVVLFFFLRKNRQTIMPGLFAILLLLSPAYWWEVLVRSDLLNNMLLSLIVVVLLDNHKLAWKNRPFLMGVILGLLCCTRIFLFIPFLLYILPNMVSMSIVYKIRLVLGWLLGFVIPFVPIGLWNADMLLHFQYSPIILQIRQGSILTFGIGLVVVCLAAFTWKTLYQYFIVASIFLFTFIVMMFVRRCFQEGFYTSVFQDSFDLSYFSIALPFVLYGLSYRKDKMVETKL